MAPTRRKSDAAAAAKADRERNAQEKLVDAGSELSFPASDPPSYMGGAAVAGPPPSQPDEPAREPPVTEVSDPDAVKPSKRGLPPGLVQKKATRKAAAAKSRARKAEAAG
jgi:hypothetical protein